MRPIRFKLLWLLGLVLFLGCTGVHDPEREDTLLHFSGTAVDADSELPIQDVHVTLTRVTGWSTSETLAQVYTDEDGKFEIIHFIMGEKCHLLSLRSKKNGYRHVGPSNGLPECTDLEQVYNYRFKKF